MKITPNGACYVYISQRTQKRFNLNREQASNSVQFIGSIRGVFIWIAFIENQDCNIRARVRSREINIIPLAGSYSGGGHANACGATCHDKKEMKALIADADALVKSFKEESLRTTK